MDVFISYRRENGEPWAQLIKDKLYEKGVQAYLDKSHMKNGDFEKTIKTNIENAPNFLLILSKDIFKLKPKGKTDWVKEEIKHATKTNRNIIVLMMNGYNPDEVDLSNEEPEIAAISTYDALTFDNSNPNHEEASLKSIIQRMKDENGKPWKKAVKSNAWYNNHKVSELDRLWMRTNYEVSRKTDFNVIKKMMKEDTFINKKRINVFILDLYDAEQIARRVQNPTQDDVVVEAYGFCHDYELDECNKLFGEHHFLANITEEEYGVKFPELLRINNIKYFDLLEATLILKDISEEKRIGPIKFMCNYLNPKGGALFFKELDDDFVSAFPDEKGYIKEMVKLLTLDYGAGERHLGKQMYSLLKKTGADKIYISDELVSSANMPIKKRTKLIDAYFSYLVPEFQSLVKKHPENDEYRAGLEWLERNYEDAVNLFTRDDFYFRAGFISGYAIYKNEDEEEELEDLD